MNEYGSQPNATPQPDPTSPAVPGANFAAPTVGTPQAPASQTPSQGASAPQAMPYQAQPAQAAGQNGAPYQGAPYGYGQQPSQATPQNTWSQPQGQPGQPYQQQPPYPGAPYQQPVQTNSKAFPLSVIGLVLGVFWLSIPGLICNCISQSNWSKERAARGGVPVDGKTRVINIIDIIVNAIGLMLQIVLVISIVLGIGFLASNPEFFEEPSYSHHSPTFNSDFDPSYGLDIEELAAESA